MFKIVPLQKIDLNRTPLPPPPPSKVRNKIALISNLMALKKPQRPQKPLRFERKPLNLATKTLVVIIIRVKVLRRRPGGAGLIEKRKSKISRSPRQLRSP